MKFLNKKKIKYIYKGVFSTLTVFCFLGVGFFYGIQSWDKQLYVQVNPSKSRSIAGLQEQKPLYAISLSEITEEVQKKLFTKTKTVETGSLFGFYLGNFLIPNRVNNSHQFICQAYSVLEATFVALDITMNGGEGLMVVQAPCRIEDDTFIGPIWLPLQAMYKNSSQRSFTLEDEESLIHFYNISFQLVSKWLLTSVRFFNSPEDKGLIINYKSNDENYFQLEFNSE